MTTGSWEPEVRTESRPIDPEILEQFIMLTDGQLQQLETELSTELQQQQQYLMKLPESSWQDVLSGFSSPELRKLAKFFTLAEASLDGWQGNQQSPVIWICRTLKQRGEFPDRELTRWIKSHTENRYLPYGSAL